MHRRAGAITSPHPLECSDQHSAHNHYSSGFTVDRRILSFCFIFPKNLHYGIQYFSLMLLGFVGPIFFRVYPICFINSILRLSFLSICSPLHIPSKRESFALGGNRISKLAPTYSNPTFTISSGDDLQCANDSMIQLENQSAQNQ